MLPPLPTLHKHKERDFTTLFKAWLLKNPMDSSCFELKQCERSLPFSAVKPHQVLALLSAKGEGLIYKVGDDSRGLKPCDLVYFREAYAYVVIRYDTLWVMIDIDDFIDEKKQKSRKSLLKSRACEIAVEVVRL